MAFELETLTAAKLASVNVRAEKHGPDELVPAVDLKLTVEQSNGCLAYFHGSLRDALYYNADPAAGDQPPLEGMAHSVTPNLRFAHLALPLKWDTEHTGYTLTIDHGIGGASNVELADCTVGKFSLEPKEGGTVVVTFTVSASGDALPEKVLGKLASLAQRDIQILLLGPEAASAEDIFKDAAPKDKPKSKGKAKDATEIFMEQHGAAD